MQPTPTSTLAGSACPLGEVLVSLGGRLVTLPPGGGCLEAGTKGCVMGTGHKGRWRINEVVRGDLGRALQGDGQLPSLPLSLKDTICGWWSCLK